MIEPGSHAHKSMTLIDELYRLSIQMSEAKNIEKARIEFNEAFLSTLKKSQKILQKSGRGVCFHSVTTRSDGGQLIC